MARYIIGIDLGTTNIAVSWLDTTASEPTPTVFSIPQVVQAGESDVLDTLPSFLYLPDVGEFAPGSLDTPWARDRDMVIGAHARKNAASVPGKTISSAKSWLCAENVDRLSPILPWNRNNPDKQLSPVTAAQRYLEHVRDAWNHSMATTDAADRMEAQYIVLTVPASFDAVARNLTVSAAEQAGLRVTLLEEPQAAFYSWLHRHHADWRSVATAGERILVCDIGGGTTDFSLIDVVDDDGDLALERVAVGNHILLGGDNLDLTLAYSLAAKIQQQRGTKLDAYQIAGLTHACREAKERLSTNPDAGPQTLTVLGRGSSVIGGTITVQLTYEDLQAILVDGFFPHCPLDAQPNDQRRGGLRSFGLDYAADPAITRHLAAFLARQSDGDAAGNVMPTAVLFNGGVTKAAVLQERIVAVLNEWRGDGSSISVLADTSPDLAVAMGAAWYGFVCQGNAIRIKAGSPHSYYVGIESTMPAVPGFEPPIEALCVVPFGLEEGSGIDIPYTGLGLVVGASTEFRFFASAERQEDQPGLIVADISREFHELPPLGAELPADSDDTPPGALLPVQLRAVLTESGTLELWCLEEGGAGRWRLEYELRAVNLENDTGAVLNGM